MKKLNTIILAALLSSSAVVANDKFVGVSLGYSYLNMDQNNDNITITNEIEKDGYNIQFDAGYNYSKKVDLIVSYQRVIHDDTFMNNFFISSNYKLKSLKNYTPYIGASIGYSQLHWDKKPINTKDNDYISGSYLAGVTLGVTKPLTKNIDLNINYQLQYMNHDTVLESQSVTSTLNHNIHHGINVGIRWKF